MSRGLGRIERAILDLIEDEDACEQCYAADDLARAVYQRGKSGRPTQSEHVAALRAMHSLARKYPNKFVLTGGRDRGGCGLSATADSSPAVFRLRPFFMLHPTMLRNILAARLLILCEMEIENMSLSGGKKPNRYDPWYAKAAFGLLLVVLVGSLVALYSGVPVAQFMTR